ncbi:GNAT family N-acetyltransferase [Actinacidiphila rubida]|uniref:L-amino acid N-acyltransferase YncA n=1 Tax=Actinacidiphila rubida TaxID=310780 RepID=A0A1H8RU41_9ACTN|nr:GNAT family N-acetyltransferase [Actinacidiphila rubida]SEO69862.1 L-amino acid N-acyltransferase YncA [Actinacidiphila rubida]
MTDTSRENAPAGSRPAPLVRPAQPADAAAIAQVHIRSREATMPYLPPRKRSDAEVESWVRDVVLPGSAVWVAEADGAVVGYAAVEGDELDALYLLAEHRRHGIGSLLLAAAKAHRPDGLGLFVFQKNTDARAFYVRHGFTVTAETDGSGNMEREPDLAMRWSPVTNGTRTVG